MKTKNSIFIILFAALLSPSAFAQVVNYYKIEKGIKTPVKEGETVTIELDENLVPTSNILVEIDFKKFKSTYKYENFVVTLRHDTKSLKAYQEAYHSFTIDNNVNLKKYSEDKYINFYLFETDEIKKDNKSIALKAPKIVFDETTYTFYIEVTGRYRNSVEEYYDTDTHTWKTKDVFSKEEYISESPKVKLVPNQESVLNEHYQKLIKNDYTNTEINNILGLGSISQKLSSELKTIKGMSTSVPLVGTIESYPQISEAIDEIGKQRYNEIKAETEKSKAIDMLKQWNTEYKYLMVSQKDKNDLKNLNKELKDKKGIDAKIEVFKKYNP